MLIVKDICKVKTLKILPELCFFHGPLFLREVSSPFVKGKSLPFLYSPYL